jgi:hypothetical protein
VDDIIMDADPAVSEGHRSRFGATGNWRQKKGGRDCLLKSAT